MTTAPCPACHNSGFLPIYKLDHRTHVLCVARECHVCGGTGTIKTEVPLRNGSSNTYAPLDDRQALLYNITINEEGHQPQVIK